MITIWKPAVGLRVSGPGPRRAAVPRMVGVSSKYY